MKVLVTLLAVAGIAGGCVSTQKEPNPTGNLQSTAPATLADFKRIMHSDYIVPPVPEYPAPSIRAGEQGFVIVIAYFDVNGRPSQVSVRTTSGYATLDESAASAVRKSRIKPYTKDGKVQPVWVAVPITFMIKGS